MHTLTIPIFVSTITKAQLFYNVSFLGFVSMLANIISDRFCPSRQVGKCMIWLMRSAHSKSCAPMI